MAPEALMTLLPTLGQTAALLLAGWYFLEYQKGRDKAYAEAFSAIADRLALGPEKTRQDVLAAIREQDVRHQQVVVTLFGLTRETVQTCGALSASIAELARSVQLLPPRRHCRRRRPARRPFR